MRQTMLLCTNKTTPTFQHLIFSIFRKKWNFVIYFFSHVQIAPNRHFGRIKGHLLFELRSDNWLIHGT